MSDFGLARQMDEESALTVSHGLIGTPAYLTSELAEGRVRQATVAAGGHGLGAIPFHPLAARAPFAGNAPVASNGTPFLALCRDSRSVFYHLPDATGWSQSFRGRRASWLPRLHVSGPASGAEANSFGFTVARARNRAGSVEASTDLGISSWTPLVTNVLTGAGARFHDSVSVFERARVLRLRVP